MGFTTAQNRAITHKDGPAMVLAGPGSGKTLVITQRTKYLIEEYHINPRQILVITFTKAAAMEMQARFQKICAGGGVTFGTFHAVFFSILKNAYHYSSANVMSEEEKNRLLRGLLARYAGSAAGGTASGERQGMSDARLSGNSQGAYSARSAGERQGMHGAPAGRGQGTNGISPASPGISSGEGEAETISEIAAEISMVKNERIPIEHYYSRSCSEEMFRAIYRGYEETHRRQGRLDFDDMLTYTWELLTQREDILHAWQQRWSYILVDEFQDINLLQYEILRLLAAPKNNLFIVGDDDQSIYRFRGAKPEIMLNFPKDYPDAQTILLDQNFRSVKSVIDGAAKVIGENSHRFEKDIHHVREDGVPIEIREFQNPDHESLYLVRQIQQRLEEGLPLKDMAILVRTNQGAGSITARLMEFNIPFSMREAVPNIYEHWIAKDLLAYLHLAYVGTDRAAFLQVMNRPKRYISREAVMFASSRGRNHLLNHDGGYAASEIHRGEAYAAAGIDQKDILISKERSVSAEQVSFDALYTFYQDKDWMVDRLVRFAADLKLLPSLQPFAAVNYIRLGMGYEEFLREYAAYRRMKPEELLDILNEIQESAKPFRTVEEWLAHMEKYKAALEENRKKSRKEEEDAVTIATLHASKGLEFSEVFLIDVNEGTIPHHRAALEADFEEERRLFYVGMTRAKDRLHLFYVKEKYGKAVAPSGYLDVFLNG
ncbi:MAG: UvrD-helicase domain-containing protein [Lachnospiraceae bacterium]|nr:UvrD-helicase domain-containing protein [Lachnospiraceae bacterium]